MKQQVNLVQLELLQGFFLYIWSYEEDKRLFNQMSEEDQKLNPLRKNDFAFWAEQLDKAGISWFIQNTVAGLAEVRSNYGFYLRTLLDKNGIEVVI